MSNDAMAVTLLQARRDMLNVIVMHGSTGYSYLSPLKVANHPLPNAYEGSSAPLCYTIAMHKEGYCSIPPAASAHNATLQL